MTRYKNLEGAYIESIEKLLLEGNSVDSVLDKNSVGSMFGTCDRPFKELLNFSLSITNVRDRLIANRCRSVSLGFSVANFFWVLLGRRDVDSISFYNRQGKVFSDGGKYYECAFGDRIFGRYPQWKQAKDLLLSDRTTRRAQIPLFWDKDLKNLPLDTPCASSIQLFIRNEKLEMVLNMRSQSAVLVLPYDMFLFTMLQEYFACSLGLEVGTFHYNAASFHYYLKEESLVRDIVNVSPCSVNTEMRPMELLSRGQQPILGKAFLEIQSNITKHLAYPSWIDDEFPQYWSALFCLLWIKGCTENGHLDYSPQKIIVERTFPGLTI